MEPPLNSTSACKKNSAGDSMKSPYPPLGDLRQIGEFREFLGIQWGTPRDLLKNFRPISGRFLSFPGESGWFGTIWGLERLLREFLGFNPQRVWCMSLPAGPSGHGTHPSTFMKVLVVAQLHIVTWDARAWDGLGTRLFKN